jgi:predicted nucleic acid-binding protein
MTGKVFVDTNLLVYARDLDSHSKQTIAADWLAMLWRDQNGRTSIQVLNEYYVTVTRKRKPGLPADEAWADVHSYLAWQPQVIDAELLRLGRELERRYLLSWWDSLIVGAAQVQQCTLLLTEDLQDGMSFGTVTVRNPFRLKMSEPIPTYHVSPAPYRGRGRPARSIRT